MDGLDQYYKFFNLKRIADMLPMQADKIYNNFKKAYDSLTQDDCKRIAGLLTPSVKKLYDRLGYTVQIKAKKRS